MKTTNILITGFLLLALSGCGGNETTETLQDSVEPNRQEERSVKSATIFSRGREAAKKALEYEPGTKEREAELIRAHAIISTLEDSGFHQSAADFKAGLKSML